MVEGNRVVASTFEATTGDELAIDRSFLSRLFLGALADHEQRRLVARLLVRDAELRRQMAAAFGPVATFDLDVAQAYDSVLRTNTPGEQAIARRGLLLLSGERIGDLDNLIERFTFEDVFQLGPATRQLFTWTMSEHLLARACHRELPDPAARASLHLALMAIDVFELLALAGQAPRLEELVADVRGRIHAAAARRRSTGDAA